MEQSAEKPKRPLFLTALCVCTFIGAPACILLTVLASGQFESMIENMVMLAKTMKDGLSLVMDALSGGDVSNSMNADAAIDSVSNTIKFWINVSIGISSFLFLLCLVGAILMWKRKRIGYYVYAIGELLPAVFIVGCFIKYNSFMKYLPDDYVQFVYYQLAFAALSLLFLILYTLNLKQLK